MPQFRKRPVVIEAIENTGAPEQNRLIIDRLKGSATPAYMDDHPTRGRCLSINTLEGAHWADIGDWIIIGVKGEAYPCKPDIFAATYEQAETLAVSINEPALEYAKNAFVTEGASLTIRNGKVTGRENFDTRMRAAISTYLEHAKGGDA